MKNLHNAVLLFIVLFFISFQSVLAQSNSGDTLRRFKTVAAGPEYKKASFYQSLWGTNRRKEWTTPVTFPVTNLDTLRGGLKIYKVGGGHQSKSLRLKDKNDKEYALRSVNKSLKILIPKIFHGTFIEDIGNDAISMSHPYGSLAVPGMAQAAGIPHTNPQFIWVPKQPAFDTLNEDYGDKLYLFEQRPSGDWSEADNLLNFKKFIDSEELFEKIYGDNKNQIDQVSFVRDRLFDMIIGDWDRHLDQWKWGKVEKGEQDVYVPIPTDRDQAFSTLNGIFLKTAIGAAGQNYLQPFDYTIKDVTKTERRFLDRLVTNKLVLNDWITQAKSLQLALTDNVIENSVKQMPAEIYAISGAEIVAKLKSRRNHLTEYATTYYKFLAEEVEIVGSEKSELFEINNSNTGTTVNVFDKNAATRTPFYTRTFITGETKEIRLFGLSGNDAYQIYGTGSSGIKVRIIGGDKQDSIINNTSEKIHVYDDQNNTFIGTARKHLNDGTDPSYNYDTYQYDKKGIKPIVGYSYYDPFFVGLGYSATHHKWRKVPFAYKQDLGVKYSISQKAFSAFYQGLFPKALGKWDLLLNADYDFVRWLNFFGIGNETKLTTTDIDFNRIRTKELTGSIGFQRLFGKSNVAISGFYQSVDIIKDTSRFLAKNIAATQPKIFDKNNYAGIRMDYKIALLNDSIIPTSGVAFTANAAHFENVTQTDESFQRYSGVLQFYIPLIRNFSLAIRGAGATVTGSPMFYQMPYIGGAEDLRGYRRERFFGKTAFTNSNELRFITNFRSYIMNGKIGLSVFYDQGRVWQPGENSDTWHTDYGAGFYLAPFNKLLANIAYGISKEKKMIQIRLVKSF